MRKLPIHLLTGLLGVVSSGCTVWYNTARTSFVEPAHFPTYVERCLLAGRTRQLAEKVWRDIEGHEPKPHHDDYRKGFIDGFSDYLQFGGNGEPPPIPPRHYWKRDSPEERQGAVEWFAGFRHGVAAAKQTGVREQIVVPASTSIITSSNSSEHGDMIPNHVRQALQQPEQVGAANK